MSMITHFAESPLAQRAAERVRYSVNTAIYGGSPTTVTVTIHELPAGQLDAVGTDVSDTCLSGEDSVAGDVITLPIVQSLTAGKRYRLAVTFDAGGNRWAPVAIVVGVY